MNGDENKYFFYRKNRYKNKDLISSINTYFSEVGWNFDNDYIEEVFEMTDKNTILYELLKNERKFLYWSEKLDLPEKLRFGVEIEVAKLPLKGIEMVLNSKSIDAIMDVLEIPTDISNKIIKNSDFEKKNESSKWIFSRESGNDESEASSPIMQNNVDDLNEIVAVCTLLKALSAEVCERTGLHINVGVDYLECNEKAVENVLKIWGECEELFFKMANSEGEVIRSDAQSMATPIKENIQDFFEDDGSVTLDTEDDMEKFLYQIQARNRLQQVIAWSNVEQENDEANDFGSKTDEEKFQIYCRYNEKLKNEELDDQVRWTSINFNHMEWNSNNPGRIEVRIFNSSLNPEIIFQDLSLVGKLFEVSLKNAKDQTYKKEEFERLFLHDVTEDEKVNILLDLLFDNPEQKKIFYNRWKSVKNEHEYEKYKSGKDTFER